MNRTEAFLETSSQDVTNRHKKSVLIVDDEEDLVWSLSKTLTRTDEKLEVICAQDGDSALEILSQRRVDVVLSDVRMPGRDGLQLLDEIKFNHPRTQVIIMTAYGSEEMQNQILARTPYYLEKPFEMQYLKKLIYTALETTPPAAKRIFDSPSDYASHVYSMTCLPMIPALALLSR